MHKSRLGSLVIDCDDLEAGARFWGGALGVEARRDEGWVSLHAPGGRHVWLQRVPERKTSVKNRVHVDIETDDVEAEVRRLEALGATRRNETPGDGWVMLDPCGNEFCVIQPETEGFPDRSRTWEA